MITTTTGRVVNAMRALDEIKGQAICKQAAKDLFHLRNAMRETVDFYMEQIGAITEKLGLEMENFMVQFHGDEEKQKQFMKEIAELENTEAKLDAEPLDLSGEEVKISEQFVEATDGFVIL